MDRTKRIKGIYCITNVENGKRYVGHSKSMTKRWHTHLHRLRRNLDGCSHLQRAWNKYGEESFIFSILEVLPFSYSKLQLEEVETKWVLYFNSHKSEYGYNAVLPGTIPLYGDGENRANLGGGGGIRYWYMCIRCDTGEKEEVRGPVEVNKLTGIPLSKVGEFASYWNKLDIHGNGKNNSKKKSRKGWIVVRKDIYNENFDYIGFKKLRPSPEIKRTWRDTYRKEDHRKSPEDIIPYSERNMKRCPIIAVNIETGEEVRYEMIKDCSKNFNEGKVYKCINAPFGKYKHRGYYFRRG
jgi:hypothetical protein